ncbi:MAG: hypothetical protein JSS91_12545 [Bacteroidetes bacterium]|nr:hypothetical protein [Bacteroidota bacterium]
MSDIQNNPADPDMDPSDFTNPKYPGSEYELISSYIDNQITDKDELNRIQNLIQSDQNYRNRYEFEKSVKELYKSRLGSQSEPPVYLYKNISKGIDDYIKANAKSAPEIIPQNYIDHQSTIQRSNLRRNLGYASMVFVLLIISAFVINNYFIKNSTDPKFAQNDIVTVSKKIFDDVEAGKVKVQFQTSDAKVLTEEMNKQLDFKVFIPDVKDAQLVGGVCNEVNGEKVAHFIHKKGNLIIYTFQISKNDAMNSNNIVVCEKFKEALSHGENWITCMTVNNTSSVMWIKDNVICSSLAFMDSNEIKTILTNFK